MFSVWHSEPENLLQAVQGPPGASGASRLLGGSRGLRGLQGAHGPPGPPGAFQKAQQTLSNMVLNKKCARRVPPKPRTWARLKFHAGWSGWTRPPAMARRVCKGGVEGVLKGFERCPEAGCLGEFLLKASGTS